MPLPSEWSLVVCGGGSGGHLFPALAIVETLRTQQKAPERIIFLTADRAIDRQILSGQGIEQFALPAVESHNIRKRPWQALRNLGTSISRARQILKSLPAPLILGTGGFSSIPGCLAGLWRRRPIVLLEQNVVPGRATSLLCRFARLICTSFTETNQFLPDGLRYEVTGNPVRAAISKLTELSTAKDEKCLLVLGGSQGTTAINDAMTVYADQFRHQLADWTILHQTGERDCELVRDSYSQAGVRAEVAAFFPDIAEMYQRAELVVTRAGGTSLAEIACAGLPSIIVPYPRSMRNHQQINARYFSDRNAAMIIEQENTADFNAKIASAINSLITNNEQRSEMSMAMKDCAHADAAERVSHHILEIVDSEMRRSIR